MDDVARLPTNDRADLFTATAARRGLTTAIIEKDFWVCWTLGRLFRLPDPPAGLLFKGGTSLSKVFGAIERFSEDVDLSFDRAGLGFGGDDDPLLATSGKKRKHALEALAEECRRAVDERLRPKLEADFEAVLGEHNPETWNVAIAPDDPTTLLFRYPAASRRVGEPAYVRPLVRLEIGARSDHWPIVESTVTPYAAEEFPDLFGEPAADVRALAAERTFWEKVTILHMWHHAPATKRFADRQSRHYYDVVQLARHETGAAAKRDSELLQQVARHKQFFFPAAWARYKEAVPGTLRIAPPESRMAELEQDYLRMREMIFGEPPSFAELIESLRELEREINAPSDDSA